MKRTSKIATLLTALTLGSAEAQGCCAPTPVPTAHTQTIDSTAPLSTQVQLTYGGTLNVERYRGHPLVLAVFSTTCASCLAELEALTRIRRAGTNVLLVSSQDTLPDLGRFAQRHHLPFPVGRVTPELMVNLRVTQYPTVVVLDASGRVRQDTQRAGPVSADELRTMLQAAR